MEQQVFDLSEIKDTDSKMTRLPDYQKIKREFFYLAKPIMLKEYSIKKFYEEHVVPFVPEHQFVAYNETRVWAQRMMPHAQKLVAMQDASMVAHETMTLLEREQKKITQQFEIRQDVTELMSDYIKNLKIFINDPELGKKLTQKEYLELYKIIREEEDRSKGLSLKERSENRADAQFAFMVSQAKAGQLSAEDIDMLDDDIKKDLALFKNENGIYQLPTRAFPKIKSPAKNTAT